MDPLSYRHRKMFNVFSCSLSTFVLLSSRRFRWGPLFAIVVWLRFRSPHSFAHRTCMSLDLPQAALHFGSLAIATGKCLTYSVNVLKSTLKTAIKVRKSFENRTKKIFEQFNNFDSLFDCYVKLKSSFRPISTGQLSTLLHLHLQPINLVVYKGSDKEILS